MIFGDGEQSRDFTSVDNVVEANLVAAASAASILKAETVLGYRPGLSVRDGLRRTIEWFRGHEC